MGFNVDAMSKVKMVSALASLASLRIRRVAKKMHPIQKAAQCGRLARQADGRGATNTFAAYRHSSIANCVNSLTKDVDDDIVCVVCRLRQSGFSGRVPRSSHTAQPDCAANPPCLRGLIGKMARAPPQ